MSRESSSLISPLLGACERERGQGVRVPEIAKNVA